MKCNDLYICSQLLENKKNGMSLLFNKYYTPLVLWADTIINDLGKSEDIVQEFFATIWKNQIYKKLTPEKLSSYLYVSVKNKCYSEVKRKNILELTDDYTIFNQVYQQYDQNKEIILEIVKKELDKLPEKSRDVVYSVYIKGMKYAEVAQELDISLSTVKTHLVRSLKRLRINTKGLSDYYLLFLSKKI